MDDRFQPTSNNGAGGLIGGYSSADDADTLNPTQIVARFDPITKRLLVDAQISGYTGLTDGEVVDSADTGTLILGTDGSNYQAVSTDSSGVLNVNILSGGGGGVQYTEGDTDASITGTAILWEGGSNTLTTASSTTPLPIQQRLFDGANFTATPGDFTNGQLVNLGANNDVTVTGTVTETNSAAIAASLSVLDDWDETDRAKVNIIVGQAGVAAGSGSISAATPRVTLATDDPAVASLSVLDDWDNGASDGVSVTGDVAHDSADAGEPVKIGYKAISLGANPTAVTANDRTNAYSNRHGIPFVLGGHPNILTTQLNITDADGAQTNSAIITVSTGTKIVVTGIDVMCDGANSADVGVRIGFGTANTPANDAAGSILSHPGIKAGSGISKGDGDGIIGIGADNEDLRITSEDPTGGAVDVLVTYFTIES